MTADSALARALPRERAIATLSLAVITALAWTWVLREAAGMAAMDLPGMAGMRMNHMTMMSPRFTDWSLPLAAYLLAMWFIMMIGMMTPSAAPMVLLYLGVARQATRAGHRFASSAWFFGGYLVAWAAFSIVATLAQWALGSLALMTPAMSIASRPLGAAVLILAGVYQWLPLKHACLARCRAPLSFLQQHGGFQDTATGALRLGATHGLYCVGCCWALMLLLLALGVMNPLWIAALTLFVLIEKLAPGARWIARGAGAVAVIAAVAMLADWITASAATQAP